MMLNDFLPAVRPCIRQLQAILVDLSSTSKLGIFLQFSAKQTMKLIQYFVLPIAILFLTEAATAQVGITPEQAPKIAEFAVKQVQQFDGYHLDYSPESLKIIDQIALKLRDEGNSPQSMPKTVTVLGCYVGEVMVRNLGYKWDLPTEIEKKVGFETVGIRDKKGGFSNPIGKIYKRLQNGNEDSVVQFYQVFTTSIADSVEKSKLIP